MAEDDTMYQASSGMEQRRVAIASSVLQLALDSGFVPLLLATMDGLSDHVYDALEELSERTWSKFDLIMMVNQGSGADGVDLAGRLRQQVEFSQRAEQIATTFRTEYIGDAG